MPRGPPADPTKCACPAASFPAISVSVSPNSASVVVSTTQNFTATARNDPSATPNVTWTLSGTGCSGATCGTLSPTTSPTPTPVLSPPPPPLPPPPPSPLPPPPPP